MTTPEKLRSLLAAASVEGSTRGPGPMTATDVRLWAADGDCIAAVYWHPLLDSHALASLIAAAVSALPALIEIAEAAELAMTHLRSGSVYASDLANLDAALAKLEAP